MTNVMTTHARTQLMLRFAPADPDAFLDELVAESRLDGFDRRGHHVLTGPRATLIAIQRPIETVIITVMPPGWSVDRDESYVNFGDRAPATPAAIAALDRKFSKGGS